MKNITHCLVHRFFLKQDLKWGCMHRKFVDFYSRNIRFYEKKHPTSI